MATIPEELLELLEHMSENDQRRMLNYARQLARPELFTPTPLPPGTPGPVAASLRISPEVADDLEAALPDTEEIWDEDEDLTW